MPAAGAGLLRPAARLRRRLSGAARAAGAAAALAPLLARPTAPPGLLLEAMPPRVVVTFSDVRLTYDPARGRRRWTGCPSGPAPGRRWCWPAPPARASPACCAILMGFARPEARAHRHQRPGRHGAAAGRSCAGSPPMSGRRRICSAARIRDNIRFARPEATQAAGGGRGPRRQRDRFRRGPAAGAGHSGGRGGVGPLGRPGAACGAGPRLPARHAAGAARRADRASRPRHRGRGASTACAACALGRTAIIASHSAAARAAARPGAGDRGGPRHRRAGAGTARG